MGASEFALSALAFLLTYAIHSTLLLGAACVLAPRVARSLALRERMWKTAMFGGLITALVQVGVSMETPLFHWTLAADQAAEKAVVEPTKQRAAAPSESHPIPAALPVVAEPLDAAPSPRDTSQACAPASPDAPWIEPAAPREELARPIRTRAELAPQGGSSSIAFEDAEAIRTSLSDAPSSSVESATDDASHAGWLSSAVARWREWTARGLFVWALFALFVVAVFAHMCLRLARSMRGRKELEGGPLREALDRLIPEAFPAGRHVRLYVAPDLRAPVSFGFVRPSICVPPRALVELSAEEQESMLGHELAHLLRRDPLWLSLAWLVERVFFFQPLHRIARAELHDVAELACDDWAASRTGDRLALASCLARIAEWIIGAPRSLPATSMAEHHGRCRLTQRIERLLDEAPSRSRDDELRRWLAPAAAAGLGALVLVAPGVSAPSMRGPATFGAAAAASEDDSDEVRFDLDTEIEAALAESFAPNVPDGAAIAIQAPRHAATTPNAVFEAAERAELRAGLTKLSESLASLRVELAPLREQSDVLADDRDLARALESIQRRAEMLERRSEALAQLIQVLETLESMPAHPSSTSSGVQGSRSLP